MRKVTEIRKILQNVCVPQNGYNLFESDDYLWGKGSSGEIAFGFASKNINILPLIQTTKYLKLFINSDFHVSINAVLVKRKMSLLILKSITDKHIDIFIRVVLSMLDDLNEEKLLNHFLELKDLFSHENRMSKTELEGMFGELLSMYTLKIHYSIDISTYFQRENRRKFDYNITEKKKIEVKTTLKPERIHHFLHQQLDTDRFDIRIISIMLQKDDAGISLLDLINKCKELFSSNFSLILHIEMMIKNFDDDELKEVKFNYQYAKDNFSIYNAIKLPRLQEKDIEGVFNIEYDVDFNNATQESIKEFADWVSRK